MRKNRNAVPWRAGLFGCLILLAFLSLCSAMEELPSPDWRARWIWAPEESDAEMVLFRQSFELSIQPEKSYLSITASSLYELYVNGQYVGRGPARSAPHRQSFDTLDISSWLRSGENVVAIRAHHQKESVSFYGKSRAGLLAQLDWNGEDYGESVQTDEAWRVSSDKRWRNESPRMARFHLEVADRMDLRQGSQRWMESSFDDSDWVKAQALMRESGWPSPQSNDRPTHLTPPWTALVARDIPYLAESVAAMKKPALVGSIPGLGDDAEFTGENWIGAAAVPSIAVSVLGTAAVERARPITLSANEDGFCRTVVYDLENVHNGRPFVDIEGLAGTVVDIVTAPYLLDGAIRSPIVVSHYVDRIVLSGQRDRWESAYMKPTRWMALVFRVLDESVIVHQVGLKRSEYPFERKGSFQMGDAPELEQLWEASAKTIQVCATDAYTDNYRERRQYAQTAYYACLGNYPVFADYALQRRYLTQIAEEQLGDGLMPAYAPRHGDDFMVILDSNCFWIRGLHQYLLYSGDRATVRKLLPVARKLMELLASFSNGDGLIEDPPQPYWLDHAKIDRRGANVCLNGHYLGALEDFARTLEWLGEADANRYWNQASSVRQTIREKAWDSERGLFADTLINGKRSEQFSEHSNAMAMALRIADPAQMERIANRLRDGGTHNFVQRESGLIMVTPAMSYFLHAGLCEAGYADESWQLAWERFRHMLEPGTNGTLCEEWWLDRTGRSGRIQPVASGRSDAQTESAFFPALFSRYILGLEPTQPGMKELVLRYYPSNRLMTRKGALPTPRGNLGIEWRIGEQTIEIDLSIPKETRLRLDLKSLGVSDAGQVTINGRTVPGNRVESGQVVIPSGEYAIQVRR